MVPQGTRRPLTHSSQDRDQLPEEEAAGWIWRALLEKGAGTWESSSGLIVCLKNGHLSNRSG